MNEEIIKKAELHKVLMNEASDMDIRAIEDFLNENGGKYIFSQRFIVRNIEGDFEPVVVLSVETIKGEIRPLVKVRRLTDDSEDFYLDIMDLDYVSINDVVFHLGSDK